MSEIGRWFWFVVGFAFAVWAIREFQYAFDARPVRWGSGIWAVWILLMSFIVCTKSAPTPIRRLFGWRTDA
jgi:hypothetical protein